MRFSLDLQLALVSAPRPGHSFKTLSKHWLPDLKRGPSPHLPVYRGNQHWTSQQPGGESNRGEWQGLDTQSRKALRPPGPSGHGPVAAYRRTSQSCLHGAPFPKAGPVLDVANPWSELQTSLLLLNSMDAPSFLRVLQFRVPS